jgi:TonB-dependent receptor
MKQKILPSRRVGGGFIAVFLFLIFILVTVQSGYSQKMAEIAGQVYDSDTEDYLPGANIMLDGTTLGASSDRDGLYRIINVPPGTYRLVTTYIGYENFSTEVTVNTGERRVIQDIALKPGFVKGEEVVVVGERQGQVKALNIQKTADNIKNVVAQEQMQRFPDLNTAEVIQRLPAVSVERDQGEARYILIRGTEPRLSNTTVNGSKLAAPEDEGRFIGLDVISANQLSEVVVTKTLTPDMDGEAIGGSVNLVTKSAFDYDKQVFHVVAGGGYGNLRGRPSYQADLTYANRFGANKNIGLTLSGSFYGFNRGSENNELEWGSVDDINDNEIMWALQTLDLRDYWRVERNRVGGLGALEYRMSQGNTLYLRGVYNFRRDTESRHRFRIRPDKGDYVSIDEITGAAMDRSLRDRTEDQTIYNIAAGGEHLLANLGINYEVAYNYGEESKPNERIYTFELDEDPDLMLDLSDTDIPQYQITNLAEGYQFDPSHYVLDEIEHSDQKTTDKNWMGQLNVKYPFMLGQNRSEFKLGGRGHWKVHNARDYVTFYSWEGPDDVLLTNYVSGDENNDFLDGDYTIGPMPDYKSLGDFYDANVGGLLEGEYSHEDSDPASYKAKENIYGVYGMLTINMRDLLLMGGLRQEFTKTNYTGNEVVFDTSGDFQSTTRVEKEENYTHLLPNLQLRYRITPRSNLRLAYTKSLARPNFIDLVPFQLILRGDEEIERGNPALKTTTSNNFDILAEHYMQGIGVLSGGFFYKKLSDIIYSRHYEETEGAYAGFEIYQPVNGKSANLYGFEVNWQQQFTFFPGFWSGFGIYANYTYTHSKADLADRDDTVLPGQAGNVGNFALAYEKYGFQARVSMAYFGKYISIIGDTSEDDIYYDHNLRIDFSANQQINRYLQIYLQLVNLTNTPLRYYIGNTNRPIQREFYSWWMNAGLRLNL